MDKSCQMIDLSTMSIAGRCTDVGYGIGTTSKIFSDGRNFFLTQIVRTSFKRLQAYTIIRLNDNTIIQ